MALCFPIAARRMAMKMTLGSVALLAVSVLTMGFMADEAHSDEIFDLEVVSASDLLAPSGNTGLVANCPTGKTVLSGGFEVPSASSDVYVAWSAPDSALAYWVAGFQNNGSSTRAIKTWAVCATVN